MELWGNGVMGREFSVFWWIRVGAVIRRILDGRKGLALSLKEREDLTLRSFQDWAVRLQESYLEVFRKDEPGWQNFSPGMREEVGNPGIR